MAQRWYQKASVQVALVSGVFLVAATVIVQWPETRRLKAQNEQLQREKQSLETQLAPFRAIAVTRYPGSESEALEKLSRDVEDIGKELAKTSATVSTYRARFVARVSANWKEGKPPAANGMSVGESPKLVLYLVMQSGEELELPLRIVGMFTVKADGDAAVLSFEAEAPVGSW